MLPHPSPHPYLVGNMIMVIKSRRIRLGYIPCMGDMGVYKVLYGKSKEKDQLEDLDIDVSMIIERILKWGLRI
jgi:hypothetical protein